MKAKEYDQVRLLVDVHSLFNHRLVPAGTVGTIVDVSSEGRPEGYSADFPSQEEGEYEHVELTPDQFQVIPAE